MASTTTTTGADNHTVGCTTLKNADAPDVGYRDEGTLTVSGTVDCIKPKRDLVSVLALTERHLAICGLDNPVDQP